MLASRNSKRSVWISALMVVAHVAVAAATGLALTAAMTVPSHATVPTAKQNKTQMKPEMKTVRAAKKAAQSWVKSRRGQLYREFKSTNVLTAKENAALVKMNAAKANLDKANAALNQNLASSKLIKAQTAAYAKHLKADSDYRDVADKAATARSKFDLSRREYRAAKELISQAKKTKLAEKTLNKALKMTDAAAKKLAEAQRKADAQPASQGNQIYAALDPVRAQKLQQAMADHQAAQNAAQPRLNYRDAQLTSFRNRRQQFREARQARQNGPALQLNAGFVQPPGTVQPYMHLGN